MRVISFDQENFESTTINAMKLRVVRMDARGNAFAICPAGDYDAETKRFTRKGRARIEITDETIVSQATNKFDLFSRIENFIASQKTNGVVIDTEAV